MKTCLANQSRVADWMLCMGGGDEIPMKLMFYYGLFVSSTSSPLAVVVLSLSVLWDKIETKQMSTKTEQLVLLAFISYRFRLFGMPLLLSFAFLFDSYLFNWRFLSRTIAGFILPTEIFQIWRWTMTNIEHTQEHFLITNNSGVIVSNVVCLSNRFADVE